MGNKAIKLTDGHGPKNPTLLQSQAEWDAGMRYRVEQIVNSIEFRTGDMLEAGEVKELCDSGWQVTIVPIKR